MKEGTAVLDQLTERTGLAAPTPLAVLKEKKVRFDQWTEKERIVEKVLDMLN